MLSRASKLEIAAAALFASVLPASGPAVSSVAGPRPGQSVPADLPTHDLMASGLAALRTGDHAHARASFRLLANRDNPAAQTLLGTMTSNGQGGPKDDAVAAAWFLRAARHGYAPAQMALADAFSRGRGVPRNTARARQLAKAAALQGQPGAAQLAARLGPDRYALLAGGRP
ncbi:MAG: tetratricopeptide repeat protein [Sandaracinobacteroides sp.]